VRRPSAAAWTLGLQSGRDGVDAAAKDLVRKLDIRPGETVAAINPRPEVLSRIREGLSLGVVITGGIPPRHAASHHSFRPGGGELT
jgi:hypothetical protein